MGQQYGLSKKRIGLFLLYALMIPVAITAAPVPMLLNSYTDTSSYSSGASAIFQSYTLGSISGSIPVFYDAPGAFTTKWQSMNIPSYDRETWTSENQLISSYNLLAKNGKGISYPGGMAATMGGGGCCGVRLQLY
jgi:hypothetical protein